MLLAFAESSHTFSRDATDKAHRITEMRYTEEKSTKTIQGENGDWTVEITKRTGGPEDPIVFTMDTIVITYTPKEDKKGCKNIRLSQTWKVVAYNEKGEKVTSDKKKFYKNPKDSPFEQQEDDYIEDENKDLVVIDHIKCEGDLFYNGYDIKDKSSQGDATSKPPKPTTLRDTAGFTFGNKKPNIKKIVLTYETVAVCADTGELLASIRWQCVSTPTDKGEITLISTKEGKPSETFKKAFRKFVETHNSETKNSEGKLELRWYCPETSDKIKGPGGILKQPWGAIIPEEFRKKWIKSKAPELPKKAERVKEQGCRGNLCNMTGLSHGIEPEGEGGTMKSGEIVVDEDRVGGGQYFESPTEALGAGLNTIERAALKFTWSGDQAKTVKGILFTSYRDISPEDISPFIECSDQFINDFHALDVHFLPTELMHHLLDLMATHAEDLESSNGPATVSIIANVGTEKAAAYTGALTPEDVASFIVEAALHESVDQKTLDIFHYIGLNFGLLMGSQNFPPTEFFYDPETGEPNVVIIVGSGAAARDVASASMLADRIGAPVILDTEFDFADWKTVCNLNLILVGGPVANIIVNQLVDEGVSLVNWATSPGEWEYIKAPYGGCNILIVAGADRDATRGATQSLIQWM